MKNEKMLKMLDTMMDSPQGIASEAMEQFVHEVLNLFNDLKDDILSEDLEKREKAMNSAAELKTALETRTETLCKASGMDVNALASYFKDPSHFNSEQWNSLSKAKTDIEDYKNEFIGALAK